MSWEHEELFAEGDAFFDSLEAGIARSQKAVSLQAYIFQVDALGRRIIEALKQAARRGVSVRVMVDGFGSVGWERTFAEELREAGVRFRVFNRIPLKKLKLDLGLLRLPQRLRSVLQLMNIRNHRKLCIVDGFDAWLGSMNISAVHLQSVSGSAAWRDTSVHVSGADVALLAASFERVWSRPETVLRRLRRRENRALRRRFSSLVLLNDTRRLRLANYRRLKMRIRRAKHRVLITNSYFVPPGSLLRALSFAAAQGTEVRILVPRTSDVFFMPWVASALYLGLLRAGVRVFEYLPSILHAKTMLIDDWALVGSSNLNHRSFLHDLEADVVLTAPQSRAQLATQFWADLSLAEEITYDDWLRQGALRRFFGRLALIFRFWL